MPERVYVDDTTELWHGNALDPHDVETVMDGRTADLLCVDAPYSAKTHDGHKGGKLTADRAAAWAKSANGSAAARANFKHEVSYAARKAAAGESGRNDLDYPAWSGDDVDVFTVLWCPRITGWCLSITDDVLAHEWQSAFARQDLYPFAPLPMVETGSRVRMTGDGPSAWTCWIVWAARPRTYSKWGTLPGAYVQPAERGFNSAAGSDRIVGGKPFRAMCAIIGDYSRPGELVVDPCCGAGTTIAAAKKQGRRGIGMDVSLERLEIAARVLRVEREQRELFR